MNHDFINKCVELSELHILRFLKRTKDACGDFERDPFDSLRFFFLDMPLSGKAVHVILLR